MSNNFYQFTADPASHNGLLELSGSLTIQIASELKEVFVDSLSRVSNLYLTHDKAEEFDLAYLQILLSVQKSALELKKTFHISGTQPESLNHLLLYCGIKNLHRQVDEQPVDIPKRAENE